MEQPKQWRDYVADSMVFFALIRIGLELFEKVEDPEVVQAFYNFTEQYEVFEDFEKGLLEELENYTSVSAICVHIPPQFLKLVFIKIKKKNGTELEDIAGAWDMYIEFLKSQNNKEYSINVCRDRLQYADLDKENKDEFIAYFVFLSWEQTKPSMNILEN